VSLNFVRRTPFSTKLKSYAGFEEKIIGLLGVSAPLSRNAPAAPSSNT
jgi:hypothetical protein